MRAFLLIIVIVGSIPAIFAKPYIGALVWSWISYMNPHRLVYGALDGVPIALLVAGVTMLAWLFSREPKKIPWTWPVKLLLIFTAWISITTFFAVSQTGAKDEWIEILKVLLMTFVTASLISNRKQLELLVWVIALSVGYFGVTGGIFVGLTGGEYLVFGPDNSYIAANNAIALALLMVIPLMRYLQLQVTRNWIKWGLSLAMLLSGIAVLGTHSRGALLAAACMLVAIWVKSRKKLFFGIFLFVTAIVALSMFPQTWWDRMSTIQTYEQDDSANARLEMWQFGIDLANDHLVTGGGFGVWYVPGMHEKYDVVVRNVKSVHSIYFQVLGEHGYIGLLLYLLIGYLTYRTGSTIIKMVKDRPDLTWARDLASMVQVSMVGFATGGAFLNKAYFDLYFHFVIIMALTAVFVKEAIEGKGARHGFDPMGVPIGALPGTPPRSHHFPGGVLRRAGGGQQGESGVGSRAQEKL